MDLSGLIFVVLAVAWAGYLIPRALRQHDDVEAHRPIDEFSDTMRVLDRRGTPSPASRVGESAPAAGPVTDGPTRPAARRAARRRRRVLYALLVVTGGVAGGAATGSYSGWWTVVPVFLVCSWLILSAALGRRERTRRVARPVAPLVVEQEPVADAPAPEATEVDEAAVDDDGALWDPLPLTLPTYVTKPAARRTVRTIELTRTQAPAVEPAPGESTVEEPAARPQAPAADDAPARQAV